MFQIIGPYIVYGIMALFGLFSLGICYMIYKDYKVKQKELAETSLIPKEVTIADQIREQFKEEDAKEERILYNKSGGISRATVKNAGSFFSFTESDSDDELTLESHLDIAEQESFLDEDNNQNKFK